MLINYIIEIPLSPTSDFGLRLEDGFYKLDLVIENNGEIIAFEKHKCKESKYSDLFKNIDIDTMNEELNNIYILIIKDIISQFLLNVK